MTSLDQGLSSSEARSGKTLGTRLKKAYQEYKKEKTFRTVVIYFAIKNKYVFIKYAVVIYVVMCCKVIRSV